MTTYRNDTRSVSAFRHSGVRSPVALRRKPSDQPNPLPPHSPFDYAKSPPTLLRGRALS